MTQLDQFSSSTLRPAPSLYCVWMDAGVVNYKLCDRSYDCERCPLDQALHRRPSERRANVKVNHGETIFQDGR
ncbi:MAG TPA: hypothetical protein VE961_00530 [Pyrinomonadaceae bacterium]|nr:hypothetical protein [Pyrinomonadaceae bacterium]